MVKLVPKSEPEPEPELIDLIPELIENEPAPQPRRRRRAGLELTEVDKLDLITACRQFLNSQRINVERDRRRNPNRAYPTEIQQRYARIERLLQKLLDDQQQ